MIFRFAWSKIELENYNLDLLRDRIGELLRAHRRGHHLAVLSRPTAIWCLEHNLFVGSEKATLQQLELEATQSLTLIQRARPYVEIVSTETTLEILECRVIRLSLNHEEFEGIVQCPLVVVEDFINDGSVIRLVIQDSVRKLVPSFELRDSPIHGGGDRVVDVAKSRIENGRLVWVVVDTDRKTPFSKSEKLEKKMAAVRSVSSPTLFVSTLPCGEIENLVGLDHVVSVRAQPRHKPTTQILEKIRREERLKGISLEESFELYFDLKEGLRTEYLKTEDSERARKWIEERVRMTDLDPQNFVIEGYGKRIMRDIKDNPEFEKRMQKSFMKGDWQRVFSELTTYACWIFLAPPPKRT